MLAVGGEICIVSCEASTVIVEFPVTDPSCAVMSAVPPTCAVTLPSPPTLAIPAEDEVQVTLFVIARMLPSLNVPVATQLTPVVGARTALAGVTEMEERVAELTFSGAEPEIPFKVAEILAVPGPTAIAVLPPVIVATARLSEDQVDSVVMTWVLLSLNLPIAVKVNLVPGGMVCPDGRTEMDTSVAFETSSVAVALTEPSAAVMVVVPGARALARPVRAIPATLVLEELQETFPVTP